MKRWLNTALAVVLVLAIAAGGFFLPNFVSARLDRRNQDTAFSLSTGDAQGRGEHPAPEADRRHTKPVLRHKRARRAR